MNNNQNNRGQNNCITTIVGIKMIKNNYHQNYHNSDNEGNNNKQDMKMVELDKYNEKIIGREGLLI